jgi:hypothetical protein
MHLGGNVPNRPIQHQIASQAVAAVRKIWADIGAAVDEIGEDYGEDLLVQPCLNGRMDRSRVWVQVKGTADSSNRSDLVRVKRGLISRWISSGDLVVVVQWNVTRQSGWYMIPKHAFTEVELAEIAPKERILLTFPTEQRFTIEAAQYLTWEARIAHALLNISSTRGMHASQHIGEGGKAKLGKILVNLTLSLMADIGMADPMPDGSWKLSQIFLNSLIEVVGNASNFDSVDQSDRVLQSIIEAATVRAVLKFWGDNIPSKIGIHGIILDELCELTRAIIFRMMSKAGALRLDG